MQDLEHGFIIGLTNHRRFKRREKGENAKNPTIRQASYVHAFAAVIPKQL